MKSRERTKAMITEREAGATLAQIGLNHGISASRVRQILMREERVEKNMRRTLEEKDPKKIDVFDYAPFDNRTANCLRAEGIKTLEDLTKHSAKELLSIPNFGLYSLKLVRWGLLLKDLKLRDE